jgi:hypothetical protein
MHRYHMNLTSLWWPFQSKKKSTIARVSSAQLRMAALLVYLNICTSKATEYNSSHKHVHNNAAGISQYIQAQQQEGQGRQSIIRLKKNLSRRCWKRIAQLRLSFSSKSMVVYLGIVIEENEEPWAPPRCAH